MTTFTVYSYRHEPSQKRYVGVTSMRVSSRWSAHKSAAKHRPRTYFHKAIRAHGPEAFAADVLESIDGVEAAAEAEKWWIGHFCSDDPQFGYNHESGGNLTGCKRDSVDRARAGEKIAAWYADPANAEKVRSARANGGATRIGKPLPESTRAKLRAARAHVPGRPHTEEAKAKIADARRREAAERRANGFVSKREQKRAAVAAAGKARPNRMKTPGVFAK